MNGFFYYILNTVLAFNACGLYVPQCTDFPMLTEKNEIRINAGFKLFETHASVAYSLTDNFLVQIDGDLGSMLHTEGRFGQVAVGWYQNMDNHAVVEVLGGACLGFSGQSVDNRRFSCNYNTIFLQGDYGWHNLANSHIDVAFGVKCGWLGMNISNTDYTSLSYNSLFVEPNICFRFGWEKFKFNIMSGYNFHTTSTPQLNHGYMPYVIGHELSTNISLNYHFSPKQKKATEVAQIYY